jgi:hypothetical protein
MSVLHYRFPGDFHLSSVTNFHGFQEPAWFYAALAVLTADFPISTVRGV